MLRIIMFPLPINFLAVFLVILHTSLSQEMGFSSADPEAGYNTYPWPNPGVNPNTEYVVIPQYIPGSGSIFANEASVTIFTNTFLDAVYNTDILREVFDLSQTPAKQYADYLSEYTRKAFYERGFSNPDEMAEFVSRAILLYFDVLPLPIVAREYANAAANFLFVAGYLNINNARDLGSAYAQAMANSAKYRMNSDPTSKFEALISGYGDFLIATIEITNLNAELSTFYVGNEWFVAAVNYRFF